MSITSHKSTSISGTITVPGDKSISHRAVIFSSIANGETTITNLLCGDDVVATIDAMRACGVSIDLDKQTRICKIKGVGLYGLQEPNDVINCHNSGTSVRTLMGLFAAQDWHVFFTGDNSLRKRPMRRVMAPLDEMGARFSARKMELLPLCMRGSSNLVPIEYKMPVASAQVKTAIILAALSTSGETIITEKTKTRNHSELMLAAMGADIETIDQDAGQIVKIRGGKELKGLDFTVPADPSSAAFPTIAAAISRDAHLIIKDVCINPLRAGVYSVLKSMGAKINFLNTRKIQSEDVADIEIFSSDLHGIEVSASIAASMIDEYPILSVACAFAKGKSVLHGLDELRVKESNRFNAIINNISSLGVEVTSSGDDITIIGKPELRNSGINKEITISTNLDHRIAMSAIVMGSAVGNVEIDDISAINTSFPGFIELFNKIGGRVE